MLTGQSADSETVDLLGNTDTFAIEQAYSEHSNTLDVEATYKHFERTFIAKNEASTPLYRWKTSLILPCQSKNYQSIDSLAHSNKAPPYFI